MVTSSSSYETEDCIDKETVIAYFVDRVCEEVKSAAIADCIGCPIEFGVSGRDKDHSHCILPSWFKIEKYSSQCLLNVKKIYRAIVNNIMNLE